MTSLALDLLRQVTETGGTVWLEGDMLRLSAALPLPDELRARLRQHKAEIVALLSAAEAANDVMLEGQPGQDVARLPREIAVGVRHLHRRRSTDPRADKTSKRRADGGDVLGRTRRHPDHDHS